MADSSSANADAAALEAGSRDRLAWLKATERLARAHGTLALLATLESARAEALAGARQLRVRELQAQLIAEGLALDSLSMGMSDDLEDAIAEGSTLVRVGSAIFGKRGVSLVHSEQ